MFDFPTFFNIMANTNWTRVLSSGVAVLGLDTLMLIGKDIGMDDGCYEKKISAWNWLNRCVLTDVDFLERKSVKNITLICFCLSVWRVSHNSCLKNLHNWVVSQVRTYREWHLKTMFKVLFWNQWQPIRNVLDYTFASKSPSMYLVLFKQNVVNIISSGAAATEHSRHRVVALMSNCVFVVG